MQFEEGHLYHIYNQGNNRQKIFFERENYLFFLRKMRVYLLPYCDVLAYCLMPNHFHWMVLVNNVALFVGSAGRTETNGDETVGVTQSDTDSWGKAKERTLNDSIGILLRSYTRAINKHQKRSGKLIREKTKAECLTQQNGLSPSFYNSFKGTVINIEYSENDYPQVCFNYIHQNPVKAGLVKEAVLWEFSSAPDFAGKRNGTLTNKYVAKKYVDLIV
jgi:putative transposase